MVSVQKWTSEQLADLTEAIGGATEFQVRLGISDDERAGWQEAEAIPAEAAEKLLAFVNEEAIDLHSELISKLESSVGKPKDAEESEPPKQTAPDTPASTETSTGKKTSKAFPWGPKPQATPKGVPPDSQPDSPKGAAKVARQAPSIWGHVIVLAIAAVALLSAPLWYPRLAQQLGTALPRVAAPVAPAAPETTVAPVATTVARLEARLTIQQTELDRLNQQLAELRSVRAQDAGVQNNAVTALETRLEQTQREWELLLTATLARLEREAVSAEEVLREQQRTLASRSDAQAGRLTAIERGFASIDQRIVDLRTELQRGMVDVRLRQFFLMTELHRRARAGENWGALLPDLRARLSEDESHFPATWSGWGAMIMLEGQAGDQPIYSIDRLRDAFWHARDRAITFEALQCAEGWYGRLAIRWRSVFYLAPIGEGDVRINRFVRGCPGAEAWVAIGEQLSRGDLALATQLLSATQVGNATHPLHEWNREVWRALGVLHEVERLQREIFAFEGQ